jgi:hypothetical protein
MAASRLSLRSIRCGGLTALSTAVRRVGEGTRRADGDGKEVIAMAKYRVTMTLVTEAESKERLHALVAGALGESLEFFSALALTEPSDDPVAPTGWTRELLRQLTGK